MKTTLNKVELNGFVGKDPEVISLQNNSKVARIALATTENYKNKAGIWIKETTWHTIVMWNKNAEMVQEQIKKGSNIYIQGKMISRSYTDKNGKKQYVTEIQGLSFATSKAIN
ncbi:MAG: single-stranded DNA-binding protein [Bacteroidota bacterium]